MDIQVVFVLVFFLVFFLAFNPPLYYLLYIVETIPMNDTERRIKEQRTVEASHKNLMGFDGKLGCIIRSLGQPVVSKGTGGTYFGSTPMLDVWETSNDDGGWEPDELHAGTPEEITSQIPVMDIDGVEQPEGGIWMDRQETNYQSINGAMQFANMR